MEATWTRWQLLKHFKLNMIRHRKWKAARKLRKYYDNDISEPLIRHAGDRRNEQANVIADRDVTT